MTLRRGRVDRPRLAFRPWRFATDRSRRLVVRPLPPGALGPGRPRLARRADGAPRSLDFDDIYNATTNGLAEADAVFLTGCGLPEAWSGHRLFVVGELGFGTGVNVLALLRAWRATRDRRPADAVLHVVSVEGYPLTREEARDALACDPAAAALAAPLLAAWPPRVKGVHRVRLDDDRLVLTVAHLDVLDALDALDVRADAWFLDGFAPSKNPAMWGAEVFARVAAKSAPGARAATFTVAGAVRRGLEAVGFAVAKKPGHGAKRERLEAVFPGTAAISKRPERLLILGAGVAGAAAARAARARGIDLHVIDAAPAPASGASGNPAGLVAPRLDLDDRPPARFHRAAYVYALAAYRDHPAFRETGVLRAAKDAQGAERFAALLAAEALPTGMARRGDARAIGLAANAAGIFLPQAGVLDPRAWAADMLDAVSGTYGAAVETLRREGEVWIARDADGRALGAGDACVVACGPASGALAPLAGMALRATLGQVTWTRSATPLLSAAAWGAYVAPYADGVLLGATHDPWTTDAPSAATADADARNRAALAAFAPEFAAALDGENAGARASVRAAAPDHLPYAGRVDRGLFVLTGLGGRGLVWAPLLGEHVLSLVCGEPGAIEAGAAAALAPTRHGKSTGVGDGDRAKRRNDPSGRDSPSP